MGYFSRKAFNVSQPTLCSLCGDAIHTDERCVEHTSADEKDFPPRTLHTECETVLLEFLSSAKAKDSFDIDDVAKWWNTERCSSCRQCVINNGICDYDKDRYRWCEKYDAMCEDNE